MHPPGRSLNHESTTKPGYPYEPKFRSFDRNASAIYGSGERATKTVFLGTNRFLGVFESECERCANLRPDQGCLKRTSQAPTAQQRVLTLIALRLTCDSGRQILRASAESSGGARERRLLVRFGVAGISKGSPGFRGLLGESNADRVISFGTAERTACWCDSHCG